jgi:hypothetical protein
LKKRHLIPADIFQLVRGVVTRGEATFHLRHVETIEGPGVDWLESITPVGGLSPMALLAIQGKIPENPPYGLSWADYYAMTAAFLGDINSEYYDDLRTAAGIVGG